MRWKKKDKTQWQLVFAWLPVQTEDGHTVWMERVWRSHDEWGDHLYELREREPNRDQ